MADQAHGEHGTPPFPSSPQSPLPDPSARRFFRRSFVTAGSTLLAAFGRGASLTTPADTAGHAEAAGGRHRPPAPAQPAESAARRPVRVSSTADAPTPGDFMAAGTTAKGARGAGRRAGAGEPQWISVDLRGDCRVDWIRLTFEADASVPVFTPAAGGNPDSGTTRKKLRSSYALDFVVETSRDEHSWTSVYRTVAGTGGEVNIQLTKPVTARWVRLTVRRRSSAAPLGLSGFEVYGAAGGRPPAATGWTGRGTRPDGMPRLTVVPDATVPRESARRLTADERAGAAGADEPARAGCPAPVPGPVGVSPARCRRGRPCRRTAR